MGGDAVVIELNRTASELLARLCVELGTEDVSGVVCRALGVFDMCVRTKGKGGRLCFVNEAGQASDVVF